MMCHYLTNTKNFKFIAGLYVFLGASKFMVKHFSKTKKLVVHLGEQLVSMSIVIFISTRKCSS